MFFRNPGDVLACGHVDAQQRGRRRRRRKRSGCRGRRGRRDDAGSAASRLDEGRRRCRWRGATPRPDHAHHLEWYDFLLLTIKKVFLKKWLEYFDFFYYRWSKHWKMSFDLIVYPVCNLNHAGSFSHFCIYGLLYPGETTREVFRLTSVCFWPYDHSNSGSSRNRE